MKVKLITFGFRNGIPNTTLILDTRVIKNPHHDNRLAHLNGYSKAVRTAIMQYPIAEQVVQHGCQLVEHMQAMGYSGVTLGVGCAGGNHRSVVIALVMSERLLEKGHTVSIEHRDMKGGTK